MSVGVRCKIERLGIDSKGILKVILVFQDIESVIADLPISMSDTMRMSDMIKEVTKAKVASNLNSVTSHVQKQHAVDVQKWSECGREMRNKSPRHRERGYSESDSGFPAHRERPCRSSRQYERYDEDERY